MMYVSKRMTRTILSVVMCAVMVGYSMPAFAEPVLRDVTQEHISVQVEDKQDKPMTMKERLALAKQGQSDEMKVEVGSKIKQGQAYIPADTPLMVETIDELSSKKNKQGTTLQFKLIDNLIINNVIVIPSGAQVLGHVTVQKKAGGFGRAGKLEFSIDSVKSINNITIPLLYFGRIEAGSDGGGAAVAAAVSVVGGLLMKGPNAHIPAGTQIEVKVKEDTDLQTSLEDLAETMNPNKPHGVSITLE